MPKTPDFPDFCANIGDIVAENENVKKYGVKNILFWFYEPGEELEVVMVDRQLNTKRTMKKARLASKGSRIMLDKVPEQQSIKYLVELQQTVFMEEDTEKNCTNYPNEEFQSYDDCDATFVRQSLAKYYGPDYVPIWVTEDQANVTMLMEEASPDFTSKPVSQGDLFSGNEMSKCRQPCTATSMETTFLYKRKLTRSHGQFGPLSMIDIAFVDTVLVTTTKVCHILLHCFDLLKQFPEFSMVALVADLGGCMGLWLGLGALQFLEMLLTRGLGVVAKDA
jgi:hypothetical protein